MGPTIIYFTGLDRCGKTSLRKKFATITGERYCTFDRSYVDNLVFDEVLRKQFFDEDYLKRYFYRFSQLTRQYIIFLDVDPEITYKRAIETEGTSFDLEQLKTIRNAFIKYLEIAANAGIGTLTIKPGDKTIDELAEHVKRVLKDLY